MPTAVTSPLAGPVLLDPGFETPAAGIGNTLYDPSTSPWSFSGSAGVTANDSAFTSGNPAAPQGAQVAFLQGMGSLSQVVALPAGTYTVSLLAAQRGNLPANAQTFQVLVDGNVVGSFNNLTSTAYTALTTASFMVGSGSHTLTFQATDLHGGDNTVFLDQTSINLLATLNDPGFETPAAGIGKILYDPGTSPWMFVGSAGLTGNSSAFTAGNPAAPQGGQVAFLQGLGSVSQATNLPAGTYTLSFSAAQRGNTPNSSQTFQVLVDGNVVGTFNNLTGTGYSGLTTGNFMVTAGSHTLTFQATDLHGGDNTVFLDQVSFNLLASLNDPGFETPAAGTGNFLYDPSTSPWTFTGSAGLTGNNSAFTAANPSAPQGSQAAFLQGLSSLGQTTNLPAGTFTVSFNAAQRGNNQASSQTFQVLVDGDVVGTFNNLTGTAYTALSTSSFTVAAGSHTLAFQGTDLHGGDNTVFIDQVGINLVASLNDPGFEAPAAGAGNLLYDPSTSPWTFTGSAGLTGNKSVFTAGNPAAPQGSQVAFLQGMGTLSQVTTLPAGTYTVSLSAAQRGNAQASSQTFQVLLDGNVVGTFNNLTGTAYSALTTPSFTVATGSHALTFQATDLHGGDNTVFLDQASFNLLANLNDPGFETPAAGAGNTVYDPSTSPWTFSASSGVTGNKSAFTSGNPAAPQGTQVAFLQGLAAVSQAVTLPAGTYTLTFFAAQRGNAQASAQTFQALIDGSVVGTFNNLTGTAYAALTTGSFTVAAGSHTLTFQATDLHGGDNTVFLDQVSIVGAPSPNLPPPTSTFVNNGPVTAGNPEMVSFTGSAGGSGGYRYSFDFNNTGTFDITNSTSVQATVPAADLTTAGTHVVHGRITDSSGGFTDYSTVIQVNPQITNTVVVSSADPVVSGQSVTFTAAVTPAMSSVGTPTGTVTFVIDGVAQPAVTLTNQLATLTLPTLSAGSHNVAAVYSGDATFLTSTAPTMTEVANASFIVPWQPTGLNVTTAFGANNLVSQENGGGNMAPRLQNIVNGLASGTLLYFPAGTYLLNGGTGISEVQEVFFNSYPSPNGTFTLTLNNPTGSSVTTPAITYSSTQSTLVANVQAALNAALGNNLVVASADQTDTNSFDLTFSGTGYTGLPQSLVTWAWTSGAGSITVSRRLSGGAVYIPDTVDSFGIIGDVTSAGAPASILKSTITNNTVLAMTGMPDRYQIRNMQSLASDNGGTAFYSDFTEDSTFTNCAFDGHIGLDLSRAFVVAVRNCTFHGDGGAAGSAIGLSMATQFTTENLIDSCDFSGWGQGICISGSGDSVIRSTFENDGTGMNLGTGGQDILERSGLNDLTFTNNDTAIYMANITVCTFSNITITGTAKAPSGQSQLGLSSNEVGGVTFSGLQISGGFSNAAVLFTWGPGAAFYDCGVSNSYPGGQTWNNPNRVPIYQSSSPLPNVSADVDDNTAYTVVRSPQTAVVNVTRYGAVGDGKTDNTAVLQNLINTAAPGTTFYFPQGSYLVTGTLDFSRLANFSLVGDGVSLGGAGYGSTIFGYFSGPLLKADYASTTGAGTFQIRDLNLMRAGTVLYATNAVLSSLEDLQVSGKSIGIELLNCFKTSLRSINDNLGIGLIVNGGSVSVDTQDSSGCSEAIRACGSGFSLYASRFEVNDIALNLGVDQNGNSVPLVNASLVGISMEANNTAIVVNDCQNCLFAALGNQGSDNAPAGCSIDGLVIDAGQDCTFANLDMGGAYTDYPIVINSQAANLLFIGVGVGNGQPGRGTDLWNISSAATNVTQLAY